MFVGISYFKFVSFYILYRKDNKRIGDIMLKVTPHLIRQTEYVKDFQKSSELVESYRKKSNTFSNELKTILVRKIQFFSEQ